VTEKRPLWIDVAFLILATFLGYIGGFLNAKYQLALEEAQKAPIIEINCTQQMMTSQEPVPRLVVSFLQPSNDGKASSDVIDYASLPSHLQMVGYPGFRTYKYPDDLPSLLETCTVVNRGERTAQAFEYDLTAFAASFPPTVYRSQPLKIPELPPNQQLRFAMVNLCKCQVLINLREQAHYYQSVDQHSDNGRPPAESIRIIGDNNFSLRAYPGMFFPYKRLPKRSALP